MKIFFSLFIFTKKEWLFIGATSLFVWLLSTVVLFYGYALTSNDSFFTGTRFLLPADTLVYYSFLQQAGQGSFVFENLFQAESGAALVNPFWIIAGGLQFLLRTPFWVTFILLKLLLIPLCIIFLYAFTAKFFITIAERFFALLILLFGSGFGFLFLPYLSIFPLNFSNNYPVWPMDLWVPDFVTFLSLYGSPHFTFSLTLLVLIFLFMLVVENSFNYTLAVFSGMAALVLFWSHPFHVLSVYCALAGVVIIRSVVKKNIDFPILVHALITMLISLPAPLYYAYLMAIDANIEIKAMQNVNLSTSPLITAASFGLPLFFGLLGASLLWRKKALNNDHYVLFAWIVAVFFLLYAPLNFQRRMISGVHVPISVLATIGILYVYKLIKNNYLWQQFRYILATIFIFFLTSSNLFHVSADIVTYNQQNEPAYISNDEIFAHNFLKSLTNRGVVLNAMPSDYNTIPAFSGMNVYIGHVIETPYSKLRQSESAQFYKENLPQDQEINFLHDRGINLLYYGPKEKNLGTYSPNEKKYLKKIFENSAVSIYSVL